MPPKNAKKKPYKKSYKKSLYKPYKWPGKNYGSIGYKTNSAVKMFPPIKPFIFTYTEAWSLSPAAGGIAIRTYRANSLTAPSTHTAGKPRFMNTLCDNTNTNAPYYSYVVAACKVEAFIRNLSDAHMFVSLSIYKTIAASAPATLSEARERTDTVVRQVSPVGSGPATGYIQMFRKINKVVGCKDVLDDDLLRANYNTGPADSVSIVLTAYNIDGAAAKNIKGDVKLTYYSKLFANTDVQDS